MKWQRWHAFAAAAAVVGAGFLLSSLKNSESRAPVDAGLALDPAARAPDALICDFVATTPNASWNRLQRGIGGAAGILPTTLPGVLVALTDLDARLSAELDGTAPAYGVVAGEPSDPGLAIAIKLVEPRRARALLTDGEGARYTAKDAAGMTLLIPNRPAEATFALAITQNGYFLASRKALDLARLGSYVTRGLPARPVPKESLVVEIPRAALQSSITPRLEELWREGKAFLLGEDQRMRAQRGRAPDFGDPAAIVGAIDGVVARRVAVLGDLEHVRIAIDVAEDAATVLATLSPVKEPGPARTWVDGMRLGDSTGVFGLSATSAVALSMRDSDEQRAEQGAAFEKSVVSALGTRFKESAKLHEVIDAITKARTETFAVAAIADEPAGIILRAPVRDAEAADKALRGVFDLANVEPFKELVRLREVKSATEDIGGLGKVSVSTLLRDAKRSPGVDAGAPPPRRSADAGAPASAPDLGAAWTVESSGQTLLLAAGGEPLVTLRTSARPDKKLGDEPSLKRFKDAIGSDASTVIVGQPLRLDPARASLPPAPLALAIGRKERDAFVRIEVTDGLIREVVRSQMGF